MLSKCSIHCCSIGEVAESQYLRWTIFIHLEFNSSHNTADFFLYKLKAQWDSCNSCQHHRWTLKRIGEWTRNSRRDEMRSEQDNAIAVLILTSTKMRGWRSLKTALLTKMPAKSCTHLPSLPSGFGGTSESWWACTMAQTRTHCNRRIHWHTTHTKVWSQTLSPLPDKIPTRLSVSQYETRH